jgi:hypothetical protein
MHIHGSDGVHLGINGSEIILFFGESKLYQDYKGGINEALKSVKEFISPIDANSNYLRSDFEINVITDHIDLPEGSLREQVLLALDPYSSERSNLKYVHTCFIGFDISELKNKCKIQDFHQLYEDKIRVCYETILAKTTNDPVLHSQRWQFYFIPFESVQKFRESFIAELNA